jgi:hypothetical protein
MDFFIQYFVPLVSMILIATTPIYVTRILLYYQQTHFIEQIKAVKQAMYIHGILYISFIIAILFYFKHLEGLGIYLYIIIGIILIGLIIGYRLHFMHQKRHFYSVVFGTPNNRKQWQEYLDHNHLGNVDITMGSFSHVTKIKFNNCTEKEVQELCQTLESNTDLLRSYKGKKALFLFASQIFMLGLSLVSFILLIVWMGTF